MLAATAFSGAGMIIVPSDTLRAIELLKRSGALYERAYQYGEAIYPYIDASVLLCGQGKRSEACEMWRAFAQRAEDSGDSISAGTGYASAAVRLEEMGRLDEAAALEIKAGNLYEKSGELWRSAQEYQWAAKKLDTLGEKQEAIGLYRKAGAIYAKTNQTLRFYFIRGCLWQGGRAPH
ncbi:MAG: hypothetical protein ACP5QG_06150 [candidate division WOR-3 bacterium]